MPGEEGWALSLLHLPITQNFRSWPRTVLSNRDHCLPENNRKDACSVLCMIHVCPLTFRPTQPRSTNPVDGLLCVCKALLRYNLYATQSPHFTCTVCWLLLQSCPITTPKRNPTFYDVYSPFTTQYSLFPALGNH